MSLRIAVMTDRFPVLSESFVTNEIRELRALGHDVRVEAIAHAPVPNRPAAAGVPVCFMADEKLAQKLVDLAWLVARHPLRSARDVWERRAWRRDERVVPLRALARRAHRAVRERTQHLHVHFAARAALDAMRISRITGIPYSVTVHAYEVFATPTNLRVKLERSAFSTSVCEYTLGELRPLADARLELVTMGIDVDSWRRSRPYPGGRSVLAIGRLVEKKGFRHLVEAAAELRERGAADRIAIVGDGPLRGELEEQIERLGVGGMVELLGARDPAEVRALLESADVVAMPSVIASDGDRDSMPVAVFEALAMELPVVASDLAGLPEHVHREWGRLVPPGDAHALANAIAGLLALPREERVAMGRAGRSWAEAHCNGRVEAARLAGLIQAAASSSR